MQTFKLQEGGRGQTRCCDRRSPQRSPATATGAAAVICCHPENNTDLSPDEVKLGVTLHTPRTLEAERKGEKQDVAQQCRAFGSRIISIRQMTFTGNCTSDPAAIDEQLLTSLAGVSLCSYGRTYFRANYTL